MKNRHRDSLHAGEIFDCFHCRPAAESGIVTRRRRILCWFYYYYCALVLLNFMQVEAFFQPFRPRATDRFSALNTNLWPSSPFIHISTNQSYASTRLHFLSPTLCSATSEKEIAKCHIFPRIRYSSQLEAKPSISPSDLDDDDDNDDHKKKKQFYVYKDDCFGFITFLAGIGTQDFVFTTIFVSLSLGAEILARSKVLPPDPKRPTIVDRKVAGVIAIVTLLLTTIMYSGGGDVLNSLLLLDDRILSSPPDPNLAQRIELAMCTFSAVTAFCDIRWRDRFDYGPDDQV